MDDPASKALGAENVDRLLAEICLSSPSVRTVLRITDDLELSEQTTSSGSDDLVKEIVGTASASFMTALARLAELREEVQEHREEKKKLLDESAGKCKSEQSRLSSALWHEEGRHAGTQARAGDTCETPAKFSWERALRGV